MATSRAAPLAGGIVVEQVLTRVHRWWSGVVSNASSTTGLGGMAQWSFGDGCMWMDACMMVALSGIMVTSMIVWPSEIGSGLARPRLGAQRRRRPDCLPAVLYVVASSPAPTVPEPRCPVPYLPLVSAPPLSFAPARAHAYERSYAPCALRSALGIVAATPLFARAAAPCSTCCSCRATDTRAPSRAHSSRHRPRSLCFTPARPLVVIAVSAPHAHHLPTSPRPDLVPAALRPTFAAASPRNPLLLRSLPRLSLPLWLAAARAPHSPPPLLLAAAPPRPWPPALCRSATRSAPLLLRHRRRRSPALRPPPAMASTGALHDARAYRVGARAPAPRRAQRRRRPDCLPAVLYVVASFPAPAVPVNLPEPRYPVPYLPLVSAPPLSFAPARAHAYERSSAPCALRSTLGIAVATPLFARAAAPCSTCWSCRATDTRAPSRARSPRHRPRSLCFTPARPLVAIAASAPHPAHQLPTSPRPDLAPAALRPTFAAASSRNPLLLRSLPRLSLPLWLAAARAPHSPPPLLLAAAPPRSWPPTLCRSATCSAPLLLRRRRRSPALRPPPAMASAGALHHARSNFERLRKYRGLPDLQEEVVT
nr:proline-rich protein 36-like [Aegilops tauschii subsp. strangulata]